jgi:sortase (surface protein transpeptidase)
MKTTIKLIGLTALLLGVPNIASAEGNQYKEQSKEQNRYQEQKDLEYQKQMKEKEREMKKSQEKDEKTYRFEENKGSTGSKGSGKNR